jgi:hypothetical protein
MTRPLSPDDSSSYFLIFALVVLSLVDFALDGAFFTGVFFYSFLFSFFFSHEYRKSRVGVAFKDYAELILNKLIRSYRSNRPSESIINA